MSIEDIYLNLDSKDTEDKEYYIANSFKSYLDYNLVMLDYPEFTKYSYKQVYNTCYLFNLFLVGSIKEYINDKECYSISYQLLRLLTNRDSNHLIYEVLEQIHNYSFSENKYKKGYTRGYSISEKYLDILLNPKYLVNIPIEYTKAKFKKYSVINIDGVYFHNKKELAKELNLSYRKSTELSKTFKEEYLGLFCKRPKEIKSDILSNKVKPKYVHTTEYNLKSFKNLIEFLRVEYLKDGKFNIDFPPLQLFYHIQSNADISKSLFYNRKGGGRLYCMDDKVFAISPQNMKSKYRNFLFEGQFEYDINTSVVSILSQHYFKVLKKQVPNSIDKYIKDKEKYRMLLIQKGFTYAQAKSYFSALFFGADVITNINKINTYSDLRKELGVERLEGALSIPEVYELVCDTMEIFNELSDYYKNITKKENNQYKFINTRHSELTLKRWDKGKVISHLYNGIESQILDCIISKYEHTLLLFDSFISTKDINLNELSKYVYKELGFSLTFSKELLKGDFDIIRDEKTN